MATPVIPDSDLLAEIKRYMRMATSDRVDYEVAAGQYRELVHQESALEAARPGTLEQVKVQLMAESAGLAATNAEKLARIHPTYLAHLEKQRDTVRQKDDARTRMVSASLRAKTNIAALKALAGLI